MSRHAGLRGESRALAAAPHCPAVVRGEAARSTWQQGVHSWDADDLCPRVGAMRYTRSMDLETLYNMAASAAWNAECMCSQKSYGGYSFHTELVSAGAGGGDPQAGRRHQDARGADDR